MRHVAPKIPILIEMQEMIFFSEKGSFRTRTSKICDGEPLTSIGNEKYRTCVEEILVGITGSLSLREELQL